MRGFYENGILVELESTCENFVRKGNKIFQLNDIVKNTRLFLFN